MKPIIAKNVTNNNIFLPELGVTVLANSQLDLLIDSKITEIEDCASLSKAVDDGYITIGSFSKEDSQEYLWPSNKKFDGWIDLLGPIVPPESGVQIPIMTALSAPHDIYKMPLFQVNDTVQMTAHIPHGIDASVGLWPHVHVFIDGTNTSTVKFKLDISYAHGYSRQVLSAPTTVYLEAAGSGVAKTHQVIEVGTGVLIDQFETDGLIFIKLTRVTNGGTDNPNNVFVPMMDLHCKVSKMVSSNRNYPFE